MSLVPIRFQRHIAVASLIVTMLVLAGCAPAVGTVTGKVKVKGKPLTGGQISFIPKTGGAFTENIQSDGTYTFTGIPTGEVMIVVIPPPPPVQADSKMKSKLETRTDAPQTTSEVKIPVEYTDPSKSPLRHTVEVGSHTKDVEIP